ncbi:ATP-dependent Zn protease [Agrobacterium deltaense]|uniref:ATP-dependent Zn protease n=1 Tax=Agrobacterium deltaense TaxID=1183412 RepID=UPI001C6F5253|nr:ATP-dependent Zn protease [Agrobacterium deltaense]MBW9075783.1 ATP-dependent Zn protease [Agrobacterium deltaense]
MKAVSNNATAVDSEATKAMLDRLATRAMGLTGADVERFVREARLKARREKRAIRYEDLEAAIRRDRPQLPQDLRWRFAVHEAGHALVHHVLKLGSIRGINIDTANGGGYSELVFSAAGSDTLSYQENILAMMMAGRAAEQIVIGDVSAGSAGSEDSDLARATILALAIERSLGFGAVHPLLYRNDKDPTTVLDANPELAARIHVRLEKALERAGAIIGKHRNKLNDLAKALFEERALDGRAVRDFL